MLRFVLKKRTFGIIFGEGVQFFAPKRPNVDPEPLNVDPVQKSYTTMSTLWGGMSTLSGGIHFGGGIFFLDRRFVLRITGGGGLFFGGYFGSLTTPLSAKFTPFWTVSCGAGAYHGEPVAYGRPHGPASPRGGSLSPQARAPGSSWVSA